MFQSLQSLLVLTSLLCTLVHGLSSLPLTASTVVNFGLGVWIENIRVRATGEILTVGPTSPTLHLVDPSGDATPVIVYTFPAPITGLFGLTETTTDVFYISCGNFSHSTFAPAGSMQVWEVNMDIFGVTGAPSNVRKVADFPDASQLDGMTTVSAESGVLLITDTVLGLVWSLNVNTGATAQILNLADMKPVAGNSPAIGVNGAHYRDGYLYYTSTDQELFVRLPIDSDGSAAGSAEVIASDFGNLDDFDLDNVNNGYIAVNASVISLVKPNGKKFELSGPLPGPTGAKFGRTSSDSKTLYVGTNGGATPYFTSHDYTTPGGILKIEVGAAGYFDYAS